MMPAELRSQRRWVALVLCAFGIVAGIMLPMSARIGGMQDADGVLTALISTQKLTWYFWGQDRLMNLLPALAAPFRDPEINLRVQVFLRSAFAFLSPLAVLCLFRGSWRVAVLTVVASQCLIAFVLTQDAAFNMWEQHNPVGTSLVLFAAASWLCIAGRSGWRWAGALVLLFLAYTVNLALIVWSAPFLAIAIVFGVRDRRLLTALLALNVVVVIGAWAHGQWFGEQATKFGLNLVWDDVAAGYRAVFTEVDGRPLAALFIAALVAAALRRSREASMAILVAAGMFIAVGALSCLVWVQQGGYALRYYLTFLTVFTGCCVYVLAQAVPAIAAAPRRQTVAAVALFVAMFFGALHGLSPTPFEQVNTRWRASSKAAADIAVDAHAALVIGDFWDVWPTVMYARSELRHSGHAKERLYGMTFRAHVLREKVNHLFESRPEGVQSLCLMSSVDECVKITNAFGQLARPVAADAASIKPVTTAGKPGFLVLLRPAS